MSKTTRTGRSTGRGKPGEQGAWQEGAPGTGRAGRKGRSRSVEHSMVDVDEIEEPESGQLEDVETAGQTGGSGSAAAAQPTVNRVCPMDDHRVDPNAPKRDFHGEVVGFCCERCAGDWDALPDEEKQDHLVVVDDINE